MKDTCMKVVFVEFLDNLNDKNSQRQMQSVGNTLHNKCDDYDNPSPATFGIIMLSQSHQLP